MTQEEGNTTSFDASARLKTTLVVTVTSNGSSTVRAGWVLRSVCVLRGKRTPVAAARWVRRERGQ